MAPLVTHLVIGERVFPAVSRFVQDTPSTYGAFLQGCIVVDVYGFKPKGDRRITHFVGRLQEDGETAFRRSCDIFLERLDSLLSRAWDSLTEAEQAFVAGYLCHLAADEVWKEMGWQLLQELKLDSLTDLPVPGDVCLTVFDVISSTGFVDFAAIVAALEQPAIPQIFTHVAWVDFCGMWNLVEEHIIDRGSAESYFAMLERIGIEPEELVSTRQRHDQYWDDAVDLFESIGGVVPYIEDAVERSLEVIPRLWYEDGADGSN
jgi:hypothetical protein